MFKQEDRKYFSKTIWIWLFFVTGSGCRVDFVWGLWFRLPFCINQQLHQSLWFWKLDETWLNNLKKWPLVILGSGSKLNCNHLFFLSVFFSVKSHIVQTQSCNSKSHFQNGVFIMSLHKSIIQTSINWCNYRLLQNGRFWKFFLLGMKG
jgi:hypothetical protein